MEGHGISFLFNLPRLSPTLISTMPCNASSSDVESGIVKLEPGQKPSLTAIFTAHRIRWALLIVITVKFLWHCYIIHRQAEFVADQETRPAMLRDYVSEHHWLLSYRTHSKATGFTSAFAMSYLKLVLILLLAPYLLELSSWLSRVLCCGKKCGSEEKHDEKESRQERGRRSVFPYLVLFATACVIFYVYMDFAAKAGNRSDAYRMADRFPMSSVKKLTGPLGFDSSHIYVLNTTKMNAGYLGVFVNPGITISESLLKGTRALTPEGINAVLAHELGHWWHHHSLVRYMIFVVEMLVIVLVTYLLRNFSPLYETFGYSSEYAATPSLIIRLLIIGYYVLIPLNEIWTPLLNLLYQHNESQADAFAAGLGYAQPLCNALASVTVENNLIWITDPVYSIYFRDHPSFMERALALGCLPMEVGDC